MSRSWIRRRSPVDSGASGCVVCVRARASQAFRAIMTSRSAWSGDSPCAEQNLRSGSCFAGRQLHSRQVCEIRHGNKVCAGCPLPGARIAPIIPCHPHRREQTGAGARRPYRRPRPKTPVGPRSTSQGPGRTTRPSAVALTAWMDQSSSSICAIGWEKVCDYFPHRGTHRDFITAFHLA